MHEHLAVLRAKCAVSELVQLNPRADAIFLQEVTPETLPVFIQRLKAFNYLLVPDQEEEELDQPYFSVCFLNALTCLPQRATRCQFPCSSHMGRDVIHVKAMFNYLEDPIQVDLFGSHLESLASGSTKRIEQVQEIAKLLNQTFAESCSLCLFAGDTNLREKEVSGPLKKSLQGIVDAWEATGKSTENKYTWDMLENDSYKNTMDASPRCRFDRILARMGSSQRFSSFSLFAKNKLDDLGSSFPSDHFGIVADIQFFSPRNEVIELE
jgi:endonuclease/exonuclease/phosphatase family metal-dependent hydrolase